MHANKKFSKKDVTLKSIESCYDEGKITLLSKKLNKILMKVKTLWPDKIWFFLKILMIFAFSERN